MLWGPGNLVRVLGIMYSMKYQDILNQNLSASAKKLKLGHHWIFQQTVIQNICPDQHKNGLLNTKMKLLPWPPQSPDLNPIENKPVGAYSGWWSSATANETPRSQDPVLRWLPKVVVGHPPTQALNWRLSHAAAHSWRVVITQSEVGNHLLTMLSLLRLHCTESHVIGIRIQDKRLQWIEKSQHRILLNKRLYERPNHSNFI